jgi:putative chitinase
VIPETLARCTGAILRDAERFADPLSAAMALYAIDNPRRQAAFLATVSIESAKLTATEESLYYKDAARLCRLYPRAFKTGDEAMPYTCNPQALGAKLYDGKWHGRGLIQLTWQDNYKRAAEALGRDYLANPDLVKEPSDAALTAAWFWHDKGCNELADSADMAGITRKVNGPAMVHLSERETQYIRALAVLRN